MNEDLKKQIDDICNVIDEKIEKSSNALKDNVNKEL